MGTIESAAAVLAVAVVVVVVVAVPVVVFPFCVFMYLPQTVFKSDFRKRFPLTQYSQKLTEELITSANFATLLTVVTIFLSPCNKQINLNIILSDPLVLP